MEVIGQLHAPAVLPSGKEPPITHWIGGWVGPRAHHHHHHHFRPIRGILAFHAVSHLTSLQTSVRFPCHQHFSRIGGGGSMILSNYQYWQYDYWTVNCTNCRERYGAIWVQKPRDCQSRGSFDGPSNISRFCYFHQLSSASLNKIHISTTVTLSSTPLATMNRELSLAWWLVGLAQFQNADRRSCRLSGLRAGCVTLPLCAACVQFMSCCFAL
jgi:hypothetical protein